MVHFVIPRTRTRQPCDTAGFGLVELMVSVGIMLLVTAMVLTRQSTFNSAVLIENQAYEVAFDIRQTQLRAVSTQSGLDDDFYGSYVIEFTSGERFYDVYRVSEGGTRTRVGSRLQLDPRFEVAAITSNGDLQAGSRYADVSLEFTRPLFDAEFSVGGSSLANDNVQIYICPIIDSTSRAEALAERVLAMAVNNIGKDMRYDVNNDGDITSGDALEILRLGCAYRMIEITNTGQVTVR